MNLKRHWQELKEKHPAIADQNQPTPPIKPGAALAGNCQQNQPTPKSSLAGKKPTPQTDQINPNHYKGAVECIDAIEAGMNREQFAGYLRGNVQKYTFRAYSKHPDPLTDLLKAQWYLCRLIDHAKNK